VEFADLARRAWEVRQQYAALEQRNYGRPWTREEVAIGFVGDVGDLMKLVMAHAGVRTTADADSKLAHELADCLWAVLVLARLYEIDLQETFIQTMDGLARHIASQLAS
jgi:NTP pyrophosphatase (non-canonical NTP hydrolase)